ncbi:S-adenosyl-L-methionine-dependent methyltransferase [Sesbania bispinosa]|nr:S-adenosyl-L-methionine-dependent methyltransferase [Sesbania bispinosa]
MAVTIPKSVIRLRRHVFILVFTATLFYILASYSNTSLPLNPKHHCHLHQNVSIPFSHPLEFEPHHLLPLPQQKPKPRFLFFKYCSSNFTNYCPCQDPLRANKFLDERNFQKERHCPQTNERLRCLIPTPLGYRKPFPWPKSKDTAWFTNVPFPKLTEYKKSQNWVRLQGNRFVFPGGGTSFVNGVKGYVDAIKRVVPLKSGKIRTIQFQLGVFDLDLAIVMDEMPPAITETSADDDKFIENGQFSGSEESRKVDIQESTNNVSTPSVSSQVVIPLVVSQSHNMQRQQVNVPTPQNEHIDDEPTDNVQVTNEQVVEEPQEIALRRSIRQKRPAISNDYVVYSIKHEYNIARPLRIYCDNSAAVFFSKNDKYSKGAEHMDLKYLSVKEEVASFGAILMDYNILTMSIAPKDVHEAQVQFALERGLPAMLGVLSHHRLPFPSRSFDMAHCSRCLVPWTAYDGLYLLEIDRVLRPGGYCVLSGPPINWRKNYKGWQIEPKVLEENQKILEDLARGMCWKKIAERGQIAVWQKPTNHIHCIHKLKAFKSLQLCSSSDPDADAGWYTKMKACIVPLPDVKGINEMSGGALEKWPKRLFAAPPRISNAIIDGGITIRAFNEDNEGWKRRVSHYEVILNKSLAGGSGKYRNVMDMNAGFGGFAAAMAKYPVWVMNVVPFDAKNTSLGIIYERGLIGVNPFQLTLEHMI